MSFETALARVLEHEGGYVHDPADAGGETYRGVSRVHNPTWPGWTLVEAGAHLKGPTSPKRRALDELVGAFYRTRYWNQVRGDALEDVAGADVAAEVFDAAVNLGVARASAILQVALNLLNRNGRSWSELVEDGRIGPATLDAVRECTAPAAGPADLLAVLRVLRGMHYIQLARAKPTQERFLRGWLRRLHST